MSIPVELHEVRAVAAEKAGFAYLLTVGDSDRVHVIAVVPAIGEHSAAIREEFGA